MMLETSILSTAAPQRGVEALAPGIKIVEEGQPMEVLALNLWTEVTVYPSATLCVACS